MFILMGKIIFLILSSTLMQWIKLEPTLRLSESSQPIWLLGSRLRNALRIDASQGTLETLS